MKKTFKFMAMALVAVVMAGVTVSCDPMDKDDDQKEQTGEDQTGGENDGGDTVTPPTLEGKQWITAEAVGDGNAYCFDFGFTNPGYYIECSVSLNSTSPSYYKFTDTSSGQYMITSTSDTEGIIEAVHPMWGPVSYAYKNLTTTSVDIHSSCHDMMAGEDDYTTFVIPIQTIVAQ